MHQGLWTIILLIVSNVFMTFAWYGQLKLSQMHIGTDWPLILLILASWGVALFEYIFMVPANRIGSAINGGPFNLMQLKVIQEAISLTVFTIIVSLIFKGEPIQWNHIVAMVCIIAAVFFVFLKG
ncbi:MAG: DMT family protein [Bacteroidales bacterium]|nr:DMT family protein [Bacteroidales bacterium]